LLVLFHRGLVLFLSVDPDLVEWMVSPLVVFLADKIGAVLTFLLPFPVVFENLIVDGVK
jgi:hypothetical protein